VSDDLDTIKRIKRHRSGGGITAPTREEAAPIEVIDWEPAIQVAATGNLANRGRVGTDSRLRAKWVSQETLE
jgi:hypothetical protein